LDSYAAILSNVECPQRGVVSSQCDTVTGRFVQH
jgi:hypothetical protein